MTIYAKPIGSYKELPKWRCKCCGFEKDLRPRGVGNNIIGIHVGRKRFVIAHSRKHPDCDGEFEYVEGIKKDT